jgi:rubrerythrin
MRSRAAAQLLDGQGFDKVFNLKGGIKAWDGVAAEGPSDLGLIAFSGVLDPPGLAQRAYAMEQGLLQFYLAMADRTDDQETASLFKQLAEYENLHMDRIFDLYQSLTDRAIKRDAFDKTVKSPYMEGGVDVDTFLAEQPSLESISDALELAQSIEVQALDLYLRFAGQLTEKEGRAIVFSLAEDEKAHLARLADLMGGKV